MPHRLESTDERFSQAQALIEERLGQGSPNDSRALEALLGERPDLAGELRELWGLCQRIDGVLGGSARSPEAEREAIAAFLQGCEAARGFSTRYEVQGEIERSPPGAGRPA